MQVGAGPCQILRVARAPPAEKLLNQWAEEVFGPRLGRGPSRVTS
jgi:hypothetical protein